MFYDIELYSVDSFFDIFTDLQNSAASVDSFFDVFYDVGQSATTPDSFFDIFTDVSTGAKPDSFFDIFTELHDTDNDLQTQIDVLTTSGIQGPQGIPGTTLWSGLSGIPTGFADNVDNVTCCVKVILGGISKSGLYL